MSPSTPFNVIYIGAGTINFGGPVQPWNHSIRIEKKLGSRLNVVGIVDIYPQAAHKVIAKKREEKVGGYEETLVFESIQDAGKVLQGDKVPHLAVIGTHPWTRGSTKPGSDAEIQLVAAWPKIGMHIEKPLSSSSVEEVMKVVQKLEEAGTVTSVGYMLRYVTVRKIIEENNLTIMATVARYLMAYQFAGTTPARVDFFDKSLRLGPIVEQATHICDLSRFFAPPVIPSSIQVHTISHTEPTGHLKEFTHDESKIHPENRIPRLTTAIWKYEGGACGTLVHGLTLHEGEFSVELVILADGWCLRLVDPYNTNPKLYVRRPVDVLEEIPIGEDDCYLNEFSALIDVIDGIAPRDVIQSPYEDAVKSYKLTWDIRLQGEATERARGIIHPPVDVSS
ncbi:hypothetical protein TREMEDRAFT_67519 [Tremella mesenterica DSM 1558]|uniref:uncharacterized protein n=1 Tax=Tremella mesenterica (strain ATCC 24925 / CBS 8224 / DSM 1558 / NBRC 9311 / NRRL Y-6157 / RJB 2259-6 / UBC 559-6) TaxID=578456 RepID=UPI0003F49559|nr:uncharacterized protein TREMEDRAFT_67519 [Tremella mesenterica DSM 1558]EIW70969.1 hypothetical protein TREMEDRAFT_67519 [Tremella mesenterica DSM 1558]